MAFYLPERSSPWLDIYHISVELMTAVSSWTCGQQEAAKAVHQTHLVTVYAEQICRVRVLPGDFSSWAPVSHICGHFFLAAAVLSAPHAFTRTGVEMFLPKQRFLHSHVSFGSLCVLGGPHSELKPCICLFCRREQWKWRLIIREGDSSRTHRSKFLHIFLSFLFPFRWNFSRRCYLIHKTTYILTVFNLHKFRWITKSPPWDCSQTWIFGGDSQCSLLLPGNVTPTTALVSHLCVP